MTLARLKETFIRLHRSQKLIGIGSLLLVISTFLPWYADLDSYKIGDEFLEVTGPASFIGIAILLMAAAAESLLLLIIVNSIYFHPKFGENITLKESGFGMVLALEPLIKLNPEERMHSPVADRPQSAPMHPHRERDPTRSFMFGESGSLASNRPVDSKPASPSTRKQEQNSGSFKIRMDL